MLNSQDHCNSPGGGKSHVCTKCGWSYPNPHPSAKNRRAHKKVCGTIKGFELFDTEMAKQNLDFQQEEQEHCLVDELKTPSPRVVEKAADERIGDTSEEDVFTDAVCEFSRSDSFKGETQSSSTNCVMRSSEVVVQDSCEVPPVEHLENCDAPREAEAASVTLQGGVSSTQALIELSKEAQVIDGGGDTISNVGLETECRGKLLEESEFKLASALRKRDDTLDSSWNDEVIFSDVEGPHGFDLEAMSMIHPDEAGCLVSETPKGEECETDTHTQAENLGIQPEESIGTEIPSSDKLLLEDKHEHQGQTAVVAVKECPSEDIEKKSKEDESTFGAALESLSIQREGFGIGREVTSSDKFLVKDKTEPQGQTKINPEDIENKPEEGESSFGAALETVESETKRVSLPNADVNRADNESGVVDLNGHESEHNVVAEEDNNTNSKLSSESYASPVSVVYEGDDASDQIKSSTAKSKDSVLQMGAEASETANQKSLETGRTEFNRVVGGLGVIQGNEIHGNDNKAHNFYAEVPVTIESNDHRDFGRLQNLSESHIRSLVSSPLVNRNNTSQEAFEPNLGSVVSGLSGGVTTENQEITLEKTTSWSTTTKEQHVPLKNLLSEARSSPKLQQEATKEMIPRVSSILGQETSSPEDGRLPERREVSEEWNSPAKYPVDLKREERKVKGRPFWVPFVCCSSVK